jgi:hypothetical protein
MGLLELVVVMTGVFVIAGIAALIGSFFILRK